MGHVITGWYKREIYYNQDNDYHVGRLLVKKTDLNQKQLSQHTKDNHITIVGYLPRLLKDELYHFYGDFIKNQYGIQFSVESYEMDEKKDEDSLIQFLSSDLFKGIGKKTAKKIVKSLGEDAIDKIIQDKNVLADIKGINENKKNQIYDVLLVNYKSEKIMRFLLKNGFGNRLSTKIFKQYKENTIQYLKENPYRLIDDIEGIGFKKADSLAISLQFDLKSPYRIQAAIKYIFETYCFNEGFTYITFDQLVDKAKIFLNDHSIILTDDEIKHNIKELLLKKRIIKDNHRYYLPTLYQAEVFIAEKINTLLSHSEEDVNHNDMNEIINNVEDKLQIKYAKMQRHAIFEAMKNKVFILTGGPGTGKTTIVNGFLETYIKYHQLKKQDIKSHIALVAPTGRAAKRMYETTGMKAKTIHKLLGYTITGDFTYYEHNRLEHNVIVVDESSMIDVLLLSNLLKALSDDVKIIFIGDINQLPSVGPGEVLKDIIESNIVKTVRLEKIHRQHQDSSIITLAHDINHQVITDDILMKQKDRNFIQSHNTSILDNLKFIILNALEKDYTIDNIQVLAPMYKGAVGIDRINECLQDCINPKKNNTKEIKHYHRRFRLGDKVIQLVNRPEHHIMNGDIGYIKHVFLDDDSEDDTKLVIDYDGNEVHYKSSDLNDITLAYCISIHKAQGSEFDIVILILSKSYYIMLRKRLLYTAVTRAKKYLIMIGDIDAYQLAVLNTREKRRQTTLKERLESFDSNQTISIDDYEFQYKPNKNITPFDFL